jgi:major membrane immunogen (membrane-anchored lipoprotein)
MLVITLFLSKSIIAQANITRDSSFMLKDGIYTGSSRASYTYEPYWGKVIITVKNNSVTDVRFGIRDSNLHENFDGNYEKHFTGNETYIQQSRNDWRGVQTYSAKLSEKHDINKVDAVTGATWSYNIFKASVNEALKSAR